jgi:hypothetical protein
MQTISHFIRHSTFGTRHYSRLQTPAKSVLNRKWANSSTTASRSPISSPAPQDRYPTALDFKNDLDHPEQVQITGRASRLEAPVAWKSRWRRMRMAVLAVGVPILVLLIAFLVKHLDIHFK